MVISDLRRPRSVSVSLCKADTYQLIVAGWNASCKISITWDHVHMCFLNLCAGRNICLASISVMCFGDQMLPKVATTMEWYDDRSLLQVVVIVVWCNTLLLMSSIWTAWCNFLNVGKLWYIVIAFSLCPSGLVSSPNYAMQINALSI